MNSIEINEVQFAELKGLDVGSRVRYLRELLQVKVDKEYYSGKKVAGRIQVSQPHLTQIERGKVRDIPSKILYAISKDFKVSMYVFFNDFYEGELESIAIDATAVNLNRPHINLYMTNNDEVEPVPRVLEHEFSEINPLRETQHQISIYLYFKASSGDRKLMFNTTTGEKYNAQYTQALTANILHTISTLDGLINPEKLSNKNSLSSTALASEHLGIRDNEEYNLWIPSKAWEYFMKAMENESDIYTERLKGR